MEITIINEQKKIRLNKKKLQASAARILKILKLSANTSVGIKFVDKPSILKLNKRYLKKNRPTDVMAFGYEGSVSEGYLGDIVICPETALENAKVYKGTFLNELTLYMIHGILHLLGHDDLKKDSRKKMRDKEEEVIKRLC